MIATKLKHILSLNGVSLIIGIVGGFFGLLTILVNDYDYHIKVKWLLFAIFCFLFILLIAFKLIYELYIDLHNNHKIYSRGISFLQGENVLLIEKNKHLDYRAMTTILYIIDGVEIEMATGYVRNIQKDFVQIKFIDINDDFSKRYSSVIKEIGKNNSLILRNLIVKNHIKFKHS